jgi:hypothetical protein
MIESSLLDLREERGVDDHRRHRGMALAVALAVRSDPDSMQLETMPLLTAADRDVARSKLPEYRGPGD